MKNYHMRDCANICSANRSKFGQESVLHRALWLCHSQTFPRASILSAMSRYSLSTSLSELKPLSVRPAASIPPSLAFLLQRYALHIHEKSEWARETRKGRQMHAKRQRREGPLVAYRLGMARCTHVQSSTLESYTRTHQSQRGWGSKPGPRKPCPTDRYNTRRAMYHRETRSTV